LVFRSLLGHLLSLTPNGCTFFSFIISTSNMRWSCAEVYCLAIFIWLLLLLRHVQPYIQDTWFCVHVPHFPSGCTVQKTMKPDFEMKLGAKSADPIDKKWQGPYPPVIWFWVIAVISKKKNNNNVRSTEYDSGGSIFNSLPIRGLADDSVFFFWIRAHICGTLRINHIIPT
jgi:hypothetical protein